MDHRLHQLACLYRHEFEDPYYNSQRPGRVIQGPGSLAQVRQLHGHKFGFPRKLEGQTWFFPATFRMVLGRRGNFSRRRASRSAARFTGLATRRRRKGKGGKGKEKGSKRGQSYNFAPIGCPAAPRIRSWRKILRALRDFA